MNAGTSVGSWSDSLCLIAIIGTIVSIGFLKKTIKYFTSVCCCSGGEGGSRA